MQIVQQWLGHWKSKNLSIAGRRTLVQSVLSDVPSYVMQTSWLPQSTCDELNRLSRNFLWGSSADKRKLHLVNWRTVTKPKKLSGLGIKETRRANIALLAKIGGQLVIGVDKMWARVFNAKYVKDSTILNCVLELRIQALGKVL